jgi:esterase/lipase superfamily enzyme
MITLDIERIVGNGRLTIDNRGSRGGSGGPGGAGGDGGRGGDGQTRTCGNIFGQGGSLPGPNGVGGAGGMGGHGGPGGPGGSGGPVYYTPPLEQFIKSGAIRLELGGGPGGKGGPPGPPGRTGPSGQPGRGGTCGGSWIGPPTSPIPGPPPPANSGERGSNGVTSVASTGNTVNMEVFYATDRKKSPAGQFLGERSETGGLHLGKSRVSIPRDHRIAAIETPSIWKFEFRADSKHHIVIASSQDETYDDFYGSLSKVIGSSRRKEAFVFIHGYNVGFEDAIRRTAQLAVDLKFDGAAITYSWPSAANFDKYPADEATVEWTAPHLRWFLEDVARRSGATAVNLIAHSMGNRALTSALRSIAVEQRTSSRPHFRQIVMAAPDIDAGVFAQLATAVRDSGDRVTIYASSRDRAILASQKFHQYPRVGEVGTKITILPNIDTIDASIVETDIISHSYLGDARSILFDVFEVFKSNLPPDERFGLSVASQGDGRYWRVLPYSSH